MQTEAIVFHKNIKEKKKTRILWSIDDCYMYI